MTIANISVSSPAGLVSILIPCVGMLEYTKLCVPAVLRCSREPIEQRLLGAGHHDWPALPVIERPDVFGTAKTRRAYAACASTLAMATGKLTAHRKPT